MTSDAKLGLLLGLVLIVAIVFAVNGLPRFAQASSDEANNSDRAVIKIPTEDIMSTAKDTISQLKKYTQPEIIEQAPAAPAIAEKTFKPRISPVKTMPKGYDEYTVKSNENLAVIAKKFYGPEEGNRISNIEKIAKFNGLKSANCIYEGQKLKIPGLGLEKSGQFVKVNSYNPVKTNNGVRNVIDLPTVSVTKRVKIKKGQYVVREDDTLWSIAAKMLGSGNRYPEILKINSNINSQDHLKPGMVIKLPKK